METEKKVIYTSKRKASNFDVPPSEAELQAQQSRPASGVLVVNDANVEVAAPVIKSGIDEEEKARLRQALLKNMEYIQRKDSTVRAAKFAPGGVYHQPRPSYGNLMGGQSSRAGLGAGGGMGVPLVTPREPIQKQIAENVSVYVNHLPKTITWNQLDILFSEYGKIKKIKLYRDEIGNPKGDALVTYYHAEAVERAVIKLNGHQIAPGQLMSVNPANFSHKEVANPYLPEGTNMGHLLGLPAAAPPPVNTDEPPLAYLPTELQGHKYPVVVCHNVYLKEQIEDPEFLPGLEAEMLIECSRYGEIIKLMAVPDIPYYFGAVCIAFSTWEQACNCANVMDGRFFDFRQMEVEMMGLRDDRPGEPPLGVDISKAGAEAEEGIFENTAEESCNGSEDNRVDLYDTGHVGLGFSGDSIQTEEVDRTISFLKSLENS